MDPRICQTCSAKIPFPMWFLLQPKESSPRTPVCPTCAAKAALARLLSDG